MGQADRLESQFVRRTSLLRVGHYLAELMRGLGALGSRRRADLNAVYAGFVFTAFDRPAAIASAQVLNELGSKAIDLADALLAGHAIGGGFTLVSNNTKHFARVKGLHLVNWAV